jgi:RND superfamily putative drug exporter
VIPDCPREAGGEDWSAFVMRTWRTAMTTRAKEKLGLAHRVGRWSAAHRKLAIWGWLAFVAASVAAGIVIGTSTIDSDDNPTTEAERISALISEEFEQPDGESVLVQSDELTTGEPAFAAAVDDALRTLRGRPDVMNVQRPLVADDARSALIEFEIRFVQGGPDNPVTGILAATDRLQKRHPEVFVGQFGEASASDALDGVFTSDLERAGLISIPLTLTILLVAFGSLVAALIPLLLALTAVIATMGLIAIPSQVVPMDESVGAVVLLIGLAVGVDYSMFYLRREREERARGRSAAAALDAAEATSGRAVLISGAIVIVSMAGMLFTRDETFMSFAVAMSVVVAVAMLGSVTVLPAVLSWLGDRVDKVAIPGLGRMRRRDGEGRFWSWILDRVLRRPLLAALAGGAMLVALALPALGLKTTIPGPETYPQHLEVVQVYQRIQRAFPGTQIAAVAVIKAPNVNAPAVRAAIAELERRAVRSGHMLEPIEVRVNPTATVATISIPVKGEGTDDASIAALRHLREQLVPATIGAVPGATTGVTGETAFTEDFNRQMRQALPWVFAFVLGFAFVLLLVSFRSVVVALKAIVLNLLSVAAAYGVTVLVFQHGWGKELLGFEFTGGVVAFLPAFLFVLLFGLSMDYHVFILSRVREELDRGLSTDAAVLHGIKTTAGVVTSAAIVMVLVFSVFGTLDILFLKQFGVALAAAILIDATIVRALLLPATMTLLGEWNWYLPRWLEWLPHLEHGSRVPEPAG